MNSADIGFGILGFLQVILIFVVSSIKTDIKALWGRANNHGHRIKCINKDCDSETTAVILKESGEG